MISNPAVGSNPDVVAALRAQRIELPSWAFGNSGTRFKVFAQKGVPRTPYEKVADAAQVHRVHRRRAERRAPHPVGPGRRLRGSRPPRRGRRRQPRDDQLERLPGRRLHARQRLQPGPAGPAQGARPPARLHRHHGRDRIARPQAVVLGRDELPGPGRHPGPPGPARRGARRGPCPARARTSGCSSSTSSSSRRSTRWTCRTGGPPTSSASRPGPKAQGRRRHRPPRAGHEHRVHRRVAAPGRIASAGSTSTRGSTPTTT